MGKPSSRNRDRRPLIAHVVYRLDVGGLENGVVNLINRLPETFAHCVLSLTDITEFRQRIERPDIECIALHKRPGKDPTAYLRLWWLLRRLRPAIVHTRNLATLDAQAVAMLAGVPARIHGEHGWEIDDVHAGHRKNRRLRRLFRPLVHEYVALSRHIADYLTASIGVRPSRLRQIYNGVDTTRFCLDSSAVGPAPVGLVPRHGSGVNVGAAPVGAAPSPRNRLWVRERFGRDDVFVVGTVARLEEVKNPLHLARAFIRLAVTQPSLACRMRLVVVGDGRLRKALERLLAEAGLAKQCWLAGNRGDIPQLLRGFDLFVLPSLAEGVSNTILEAMASGLPVVATDVGGNPELVAPGETGTLVPAADVDALAAAIAIYACNPALCAAHGAAGRRRVETRFGLSAMVAAYESLYEDMLARSASRTAAMRRETGV